MPFAGAAIALAAAFEIEFTDGYVFAADPTGVDLQQAMLGQIRFRRLNGPFEEQADINSGATNPNTDGTLADHPIARGRNASEAVE